MFVCLVVLDDFHLQLSTQLTADLTLKWCGESMFHPMSLNYAKTPFVELKKLQTTLWIFEALLFLIDYEQTRHSLWTQLFHWKMILQNGEHTAFWYLQLLCHLKQLQFTISQYEFVEFFGAFRDNCRICVTWEFIIIFACTAAFKTSVPSLNRYLRWSRVRKHFSRHWFP